MIIHDFNIVRLVLGPDEADPVLVVDPDAVLALAVAGESLQAITGRGPEIIKALGGIELVELAKGHGPEALGATAAGFFGVAAIENILCALVLERADHDDMVARMVCYGERPLSQTPDHPPSGSLYNLSSWPRISSTRKPWRPSWPSSSRLVPRRRGSSPLGCSGASPGGPPDRTAMWISESSTKKIRPGRSRGSGRFTTLRKS